MWLCNKHIIDHLYWVCLSGCIDNKKSTPNHCSHAAKTHVSLTVWWHLQAYSRRAKLSVIYYVVIPGNLSNLFFGMTTKYGGVLILIFNAVIGWYYKEADNIGLPWSQGKLVIQQQRLAQRQVYIEGAPPLTSHFLHLCTSSTNGYYPAQLIH